MRRWLAPHRSNRPQSGQTIYVVLLILAAIALAAAVFFPTFEYFTLYAKKDFPPEPRSLLTEADKTIPADGAPGAPAAADKGGGG